MDKKKIIILSSLLLVLIVLIILIFTTNNKNEQEEKPKEFTPAFLNDEQKEQFDLDKDTKAQVFYDNEGKPIYRIIRNDNDIITNPEEYK